MTNASAIRCLVTAGPTREWLDPVRFLSNPSTGKMGYAVAEAARERGWEVRLVSGPVAAEAPEGVAFTSVETARDMLEACLRLFPETDLLVMTAAVCDHRPAEPSPQKLKKADFPPSLELAPNPDVLAELGKRKNPGQTLVGFAAETEDGPENARRKLAAKNLDWIALNDVSAPGRGFASDDNEITLLAADGSSTVIGPASKQEVARTLLRVVAP